MKSGLNKRRRGSTISTKDWRQAFEVIDPTLNGTLRIPPGKSGESDFVLSKLRLDIIRK